MTPSQVVRIHVGAPFGWRHRLGRSADARSIQAHFPSNHRRNTMSTRGLIAIMDDDGSCRSIYCHHDMHPSHADVVLPEHYPTREAVEARFSPSETSPPSAVPSRNARRTAATGARNSTRRRSGATAASRPRGVRPLLGELLLSLHGRRVALLRRWWLDASRRLAGIARQALLFELPPCPRSGDVDVSICVAMQRRCEER